MYVDEPWNKVDEYDEERRGYEARLPVDVGHGV